MSAAPELRRLAAIMFTDMVGYTALSQRNEALALELLEEHRRILRSIFPRFNGTEIKTIGDAFLVEFQSALEAAQCALEIQRTLAKRNPDVSSDRHIELRIGIHVGDVVHREGDVYGDGVNIASRIQPVAGIGGICISVDVERQIHHALDARFEKLAPIELKNVEVPMDLFRIVLPWERQISEIRSQRSGVRKSSVVLSASKLLPMAILLLAALGIVWWWATRKPLPAHDQRVSRASDQVGNIPDKSIAVLPFENLSSEKENAYFAQGIQDEILTKLSKIADLKVISRTSTQKYTSAPDNLRDIGKQLGVAHFVEGSVQKIANAVHVNVQLIRAATDEHLWAESYNRKLDDVFGVEGEVASAIADQLKAKLTGAEAKAVNDKPTENVGAYDSFLHGIALESPLTTESATKAAAAYADAVRLDPKFALAWARLAIAQSYLYFNGVEPTKNSGAAVKEAADRALALQPELGEALLAQGVYRYRVLRDFPAALQSYTEAFTRLPSSALVLEQMAHLERRLGQTESAKKHYQMAAQLDPRNLDTLLTLADLLASLRRFEEAEDVSDRILQISPDNQHALAQKAFLFQSDGMLDKSAKILSSIPADSKEDDVVLARIFQSYFERNFDAAITQFQNSRSSVVNDPRSITLLGYCQLLAGRTSEAQVTLQRAISIMKPSPDSVVPVDARTLPCYLALAYSDLGQKEKALDCARQGVADYQNDVLAKPFAESALAQIQARFGETDAAIAALPHLLEEVNGLTKGNLQIDPAWDPLRNDPRFQKLAGSPAPESANK